MGVNGGGELGDCTFEVLLVFSFLIYLHCFLVVFFLNFWGDFFPVDLLGRLYLQRKGNIPYYLFPILTMIENRTSLETSSPREYPPSNTPITSYASATGGHPARASSMSRNDKAKGTCLHVFAPSNSQRARVWTCKLPLTFGRNTSWGGVLE